MGRTRKVGIAGRYGSRYGYTLRKRVREVLEKRYADHKCPFCGVKGKIKRVSVGIWICKKCGTKFAGGAYIPVTSTGKYSESLTGRLKVS